MGSLRGNLLLPTPTLCKVVEKIQTECLQRQIGKCRRKKTNFATWKIFITNQQRHFQYSSQKLGEMLRVVLKSPWLEIL